MRPAKPLSNTLPWYSFSLGRPQDRLLAPLHWGAPGVLTLVMIIGGCRTSQPMGSMFQITEDPAATVADVPAPEQRLATVNSAGSSVDRDRVGRLSPTQQKMARAAMPDVFREDAETDAAQSLAEQTEGAQAETIATAVSTHSDAPSAIATVAHTEPVADTEPRAPQPSRRVAATEQQNASSKSSDNTEVNISPDGLVSASFTDLSKSDGLTSRMPAKTSGAVPPQGAATASAPTEETPASSGGLVKSKDGDSRPANRQTINLSGQPRSLGDALTKSIDRLPTLPESQLTETDPKPRRLNPESDNAVEQTATHNPSNETVHDLEALQVGDLISSAPAPITAAVAPRADSNRRTISESGDSDQKQALHRGHSPDVRTVAHIETVDPNQPTTNVTETVADRNAKASTSEQELFRQLLDRLASPVEGETLAERERRMMVARHLMVLAGNPDQAIESMKGLNANEQAYLQNQLMGLWTMIDPEGHPSSGRRITEALPRFKEAARHLSAATDSLTLDHLEFCTEIESYGQIKPFDGNRFNAGDQVILYCEVENFAAEAKEGQFQTRLQGNYELYDESGSKVFSQLLPVDQQRSRNRLRDYFVAYQMNLPKSLEKGSYRLQLTLEDTVGKKYGQAEIPFEIR